MDHAKEFKCPYCHFRNSAVFGTKRSVKVTCINCGLEFSAEMNEHGRVTSNSRKKPAGIAK